MRKIETAILAAVKSGTNACISNTVVEHWPAEHRCHVLLHGNRIIEMYKDTAYLHPAKDGWIIRWSLAGWNTSTTRNRINLIAREFGVHGVYTRLGQAYRADGIAVNDDAWVGANKENGA